MRARPYVPKMAASAHNKWHGRYLGAILEEMRVSALVSMRDAAACSGKSGGVSAEKKSPETT